MSAPQSYLLTDFTLPSVGFEVDHAVAFEPTNAASRRGGQSAPLLFRESESSPEIVGFGYLVATVGFMDLILFKRDKRRET